MRRRATDSAPPLPFPRPGVTAREIGRFRRYIDYVKAWEATGRTPQPEVHLRGEGSLTVCGRATSVHRSTGFASSATCTACQLQALLLRIRG
jgi:hypothetical protein